MKLLVLLQNLIVVYAFSVGFEHVDILQSGGTFTLAKLLGIFVAIFFWLHIPTQNLRFTDKASLRNSSPVLIFILFFCVQNLLNFSEYSATLIDVGFLLNIFIFLVLQRYLKFDLLLVERCLSALAIGALLSCFLLILGVGLEINDDGRHTIFGANHNELAFKFTLAFGVYLSMFERESKWSSRVLLTMTLLMLAYGVTLTGSRSALLSILLIGSVFTFANQKVSKFGKAFIFGALSSVVVFQITRSAELLARFTFATTAGGENDALGGRILLWGTIIELIQDAPLLGVGRSGYEHAIYLAAGKVLNPHNVILETLVYTGIVGTAVLAVFFKRLASTSLKQYTNFGYTRPLYLVLPLGLMVVSQQIFAIKLFWLIAAIVFAESIAGRDHG